MSECSGRASPGRGKKAAFSIGTKNESSLHRSLKFRYSGAGGSTETPEGSYICDACTNSGELVEVQTGSFAPLKEKVKNLSRENKVRIIHPIIVQKIIELYNSEGELVSRRKSPRKGRKWDLFKALVYAPDLALTKNLIIELAVIDAVETRVDNGEGSWRRKGVSITGRAVSAWHCPIVLKSVKDYGQFIPFKKNEPFTVRDLAGKTGINAALGRKTVYALVKIGLLEKTGKRGKAFVYGRIR